MYPSFIAISKRFALPHWKACKPLLLVSGWAALAAYGLMLLCLYPYPVTVTELVTVFLKLFCLSNVTVLNGYALFVTLKVTGTRVIKFVQERVRISATGTRGAEATVFPALPADLPYTSVEPAV